jgi:hypothetical protein
MVTFFKILIFFTKPEPVIIWFWSIKKKRELVVIIRIKYLKKKEKPVPTLEYISEV